MRTKELIAQMVEDWAPPARQSAFILACARLVAAVQSEPAAASQRVDIGIAEVEPSCVAGGAAVVTIPLLIDGVHVADWLQEGAGVDAVWTLQALNGLKVLDRGEPVTAKRLADMVPRVQALMLSGYQFKAEKALAAAPPEFVQTVGRGLRKPPAGGATVLDFDGDTAYFVESLNIPDTVSVFIGNRHVGSFKVGTRGPFWFLHRAGEAEPVDHHGAYVVAETKADMGRAVTRAVKDGLKL